MEDYSQASAPRSDVQLEASRALERGDFDAAYSAYERAIKQDREDFVLLADYGFLLWRTYEFDRGREVFARLLADRRTTPPILKAIAKQFFMIGRFGASADAMRVVVDRAGTSDREAMELYAGALERDSQIDSAREQAERVLSLYPDSGRATRLLAHLDKRADQYESAVQRLQTFLEKYPGEWDWGLRYELAGSLDRLGRYEEAWTQLELAKSQLLAQTKSHLRDSYIIRQRQWELVQEITNSDLSRWFREADRLEDSPLRVALLAGFPRSGTTLLEQMIAAHPACIGTDETGILATQFTAPIVWQAKSAPDAIIEIRSLDTEQIRAGRETYQRLTESFLQEPLNGRLLIEKEPLMTPDLAVPLRLFPDASVLMPLRDPRDVVISYYFTMVPLNWNSAPAISIVESAKFYFDCMRHWIALRDRLPWSSCELRYEELVVNPEETLKHAAEFLALPWDDSMLDRRHRSERRAVRTPTYDDITKPIFGRAVGRWVNYEKHLEPALEPLVPFLQAFGYE